MLAGAAVGEILPLEPEAQEEAQTGEIMERHQHPVLQILGAAVVVEVVGIQTETLVQPEALA